MNFPPKKKIYQKTCLHHNSFVSAYAIDKYRFVVEMVRGFSLIWFLGFLQKADNNLYNISYEDINLVNL